MDTLNFYDLFVNQLIGDPVLFIIIVFGITLIVLVRTNAPSNLMNFILLVIAGILAIEFPILRWGIAIFGLGFVGWVMIRIRRE